MCPDRWRRINIYAKKQDNITCKAAVTPIIHDSKEGLQTLSEACFFFFLYANFVIMVVQKLSSDMVEAYIRMVQANFKDF